MAVPQSAFLCQSVMVHERGLFSSLGIGLSSLAVSALPAVVNFTLVTIVKWDRTESGASHLIVLKVLHGDETVSRVELPAVAPPWNEVQGSGTNVIYGFVFDARRAGIYEVVVSSDAEELCRLPLEVASEMPTM